jgi:hypothetical protein
VRSECNDADDGDTGPNDLQNKPILTSAATSSTATTSSTRDISEFSAPSSVKDAAGPRVKSVTSAENATGVSPTANVTALFSEAMNSSTVNATTVQLKNAGTTTNVSAMVSYDPATHKATLNPGASLSRGAKYVATVTTGTKDLAGNALDQDPAKTGNQAKVWSFTIHQ